MRITRSLLLTGTILPALLLSDLSFARSLGEAANGRIELAQRDPEGPGGPGGGRGGPGGPGAGQGRVELGARDGPAERRAAQQHGGGFAGTGRRP